MLMETDGNQIFLYSPDPEGMLTKNVAADVCAALLNTTFMFTYIHYVLVSGILPFDLT